MKVCFFCVIQYKTKQAVIVIQIAMHLSISKYK